MDKKKNNIKLTFSVCLFLSLSFKLSIVNFVIVKVVRRCCNLGEKKNTN